MKSAIDRFLDKVDKSADCWIWKGATNRKVGTHPRPYGQMYLNGKLITAHRASYLLFIGEIPEGMYVCHKCDNTLCVNPEHLFAGTQKENMQDAVSKGRHYMQINPKDAPRKKLTDEIVLMIRATKGILMPTALGRKLGVHPSTILHIRKGKSWKHLIDAAITEHKENQG